MPPHPWTCANERLYYIYIYIRHEREIIIYICAYLLLGHVQHVFHHLDLAAAIKNKKIVSAPLAFIHLSFFRRRQTSNSNVRALVYIFKM